jgi:hypothetical protein
VHAHRSRPALAALFAVILGTLLAAGEQAPPAGEHLILVTLDGARTEEIFGGQDEAVAVSTLQKGQQLATHPTFGPLMADTPEARRLKLMPVFWGTWMSSHGSIAGNRRLGSVVTLTNRHRFSYPGYAEILLGEAHDDVIDSNDATQNPYPTVLEAIRQQAQLPASGVGVFASWVVFDAIAEHERGALTVNAGYEPYDGAGPDVEALNQLQAETRTPWNSVRHDAYTFRFAMDFMRQHRPRALYLALGETDDWAHDGRYDRVLEAYRRTDQYLEALWNWVQQDPENRGHTHILLTTDHGRGHTTDDWRKHGDDIEGAQDVWMAFVSPAMTARGEWKEHPPLHTNQAAATMAGWLGLDWVAMHPAAGRPIPAR